MEKVIRYLEDIGVDFTNEGHPLVSEYKSVCKYNDLLAKKAFEHLLMILVIDLEVIRKHDPHSYQYYLKRIKKRDISFWGERFEIYYYSKLLSSKIISKVKRGNPNNEPDFICEYESHLIQIETTSFQYLNNGLGKDSIIKMLKIVNKKNEKIYATSSCVLVIDISNMVFNKKLIGKLNESMTEILNNLQSAYGAVLFMYSYHEIRGGNLHYMSQAYQWTNSMASKQLSMFIENSKIAALEPQAKLYFKRI